MHGHMVCNSLPDDLRAQQDYESFRQGLKTWLFSSALQTFVIMALYKSTFTISYPWGATVPCAFPQFRHRAETAADKSTSI